MSKNQRDLSFAKTLDKFIVDKALKGLNLLSCKDLESKLPKELIIQSSYFIDSNKIVNLPTLVKTNNDLNSEIIKATLMVILKNYKLL